jgi:SAM-dependent methyltransferase
MLREAYVARFLERLAGAREVIEFAYGPAVLTLVLLRTLPGARVTGLDVSPSSHRWAERLVGQEGFAGRARLLLGDVFEADRYELPVRADAVICGEFLEHVSQPAEVFRLIQARLAPGGLAYVTAALTAANIDHIYHFAEPEEVRAMARAAGFEVRFELVVAAERQRQQGLPVSRTMALVLAASGEP